MKVLILGYGYMGRIRHQYLQKHPSLNIKIYDPALTAKDAGVDESQWLKCDVIPWENFDAVFVCTPNNVTAALCAQALRHCRNVFCEKPPGRNWEDFCLIEQAAKTIGRYTLVFGFNHRLHPSVQAAKSLLGEGGLGEVLYLKATYGKSGGTQFRKSWRNNREISGGGILLDQGIHMLDLFHFFLGPLQPVSALMRDSFWSCGVEDNAFVLMRSEKNVPAFLHSSATLWKHEFRIEIGCRDGYLALKGFLSKTGSYGREQLVIGRRQFEDEAMALGNPREEIIYFDRDDSWEKEIQEFLSAIQEGRPARHGTLDEAKRVMAFIRDVYEGQGAEARS